MKTVGNDDEEYKFIWTIVYDTLKACAPGLSDGIKKGIATSVALKLRAKVNLK